MYWPFFVLGSFYLTAAFFGLRVSLAICVLLVGTEYIFKKVRHRTETTELVERLRNWFIPRPSHTQRERRKAHFERRKAYFEPGN